MTDIGDDISVWFPIAGENGTCPVDSPSIRSVVQVSGGRPCFKPPYGSLSPALSSLDLRPPGAGLTHTRDGRFGSKVGQIGPKWDKSGVFFRSDFSAFGAGAPNALKSDLKKPRICPIWGQFDPL